VGLGLLRFNTETYVHFDRLEIGFTYVHFDRLEIGFIVHVRRLIPL